MVNADRAWQIPTANLTISDAEIHLWCVEIDRPQSEIQNIAQILSDSELQKSRSLPVRSRQKNVFI
ncbi:MAG: hypothetical protein HC894_25200, partial [Microcoleus sp. SM1_3_4]|nr:hypothetical protein [Microcoleus sp. SM1_3_4]